MLRLVVLPQALRVIVPPLTSQYLNLVKNSSLAIAIGYPDLFNVSTTVANQTGQPVAVIALVMARLPRHQPRHVAAHEPLQPARPDQGALSMAGRSVDPRSRARDLPPPVSERGAIGWLRHNLFSDLAATRCSRSSSVAIIALGCLAAPELGPDARPDGASSPRTCGCS